jgi:hypothetical protein
MSLAEGHSKFLFGSRRIVSAGRSEAGARGSTSWRSLGEGLLGLNGSNRPDATGGGSSGGASGGSAAIASIAWVVRSREGMAESFDDVSPAAWLISAT